MARTDFTVIKPQVTDKIVKPSEVIHPPMANGATIIPHTLLINTLIKYTYPIRLWMDLLPFRIRLTN